jgi:hypothetical protein
MLKLYVVVRNDIDVPFQMCQVAHAVADFSREHPLEFRNWNTGNNTICVLQVPHGYDLERLIETAKDGNIKHTAFYEPDIDSLGWRPYDRTYGCTARNFGDGPWLTAVAFEPNWAIQNIVLADLPLALSPETVQRKVGLTEDRALIPKSEYSTLKEAWSTLRKLQTESPKFRRQYFKQFKTRRHPGDYTGPR